MLAKEEVKLEEILELDVADGRVVSCVVVEIRKHPTLGDHIVVAYSKYGVKVSPQATFDPCSSEIQQSLRRNAQQGMGEEEKKTRKEDEGKERARKREQEE